MKLKKYFLIIIAFLTSVFSRKSFEEFLNDNRGGIVFSFLDKSCDDLEWLEYRGLEVDNSVEPIKPDDLPSDFCDEPCRLVDEFHRKTVNENVEWLLYFDYTTGEVIYCWKGDSSGCNGDYNGVHFKGKKIVSIHNHINGYYSFPSPDNFDILENDFEDYEIITSVNAFWIVEFKGEIPHEVRKAFQRSLAYKFEYIKVNLILTRFGGSEINQLIEEEISNYLLRGLDKKINRIDLNLIKGRFG